MNLVFISLDTVRKDHLPTYGYSRDTAPYINKFSTKACVFENAFAQDTNTNPSHTSMFTGVYPNIHGNIRNGSILSPKQITLAQILQNEHFRTGAFISGYTLKKEASGLQRGFEVYDDNLKWERDGRITTDLAIDWLDRLKKKDRYFLFLHLYDAHGPYKPKGKYADIFKSDNPGPILDRIPKYQFVRDKQGNHHRELNYYVDRYDDLIRYLDYQVERILSKINLKNTIVVIIADHGESLNERFWKLDHGGQVYNEQTHIPLIIYVPRIKPRRIKSFVQTVDLLPTLLQILDIKLPNYRPVSGKSLVPLIYGKNSNQDKKGSKPSLIFSSARPENKRYDANKKYKLDKNKRIMSVRSAKWKLIQFPGLEKDYFELYDLENDPKETKNIINDYPKIMIKFQSILKDFSNKGLHNDVSQTIKPNVLERLKSLGYVE